MNGILLFDKPKGWTSHDAVQFLRKKLPKGVRVGHAGTLDPLATGLLVVLIGPATRNQAAFQKLPKAYRGKIVIGLETETGDIDGRDQLRTPVPDLTKDQLRKALGAYVGRITLPLPLYSAAKYRGRPRYYYARKGIKIPPAERSSEIYNLEVLDYREPEVSFYIECSSGTYIRSLALDLGRNLGCGASVSELRRESVGPFRLENALSWGQALHFNIPHQNIEPDPHGEMSKCKA